MVDFFNRRGNFSSTRAVGSNQPYRRFLLMIDNIEKIAKNDRRFFFLDFLARLIKDCSYLQIMVSTCELMESKFIPQKV